MTVHYGAQCYDEDSLGKLFVLGLSLFPPWAGTELLCVSEVVSKASRNSSFLSLSDSLEAFSLDELSLSEQNLLLSDSSCSSMVL